MAGELKTLLTEWSAKRQIDVSEPDEHGRQFLVFDGTIEVALSQLGNRIYLETSITSVPLRRTEAEEMLQQIMSFQLSRMRTQKATLSINEDEDTLELFQIVRSDQLTLLRFEAVLGDFVNSAAAFASFTNVASVPMPDNVPVSGQMFI